MDSVGWGIIGCGGVVERKSGAPLQRSEGSRIVAVMRRNEEKARAFAARHGVPFCTTDAQALVAHPEVSAVYVATPTEHHLEYARLVCAARKPCMVEKPAGRSEEECRQIVSMFDDAKLPLFVSYYRRHLPKFRRVGEILDSGCLGEIVAISYRLSKRPGKADWRHSARASGGGLFYDLSGHVFDLFDAWFGPLEVSGSSVTNRIPGHETEDAVAVSFRTRAGAIGTATWNFAGTQAEDELVIEGLRGQMRLAGMDCASKVVVELSAAGALRLSQSTREWKRRRVRRALRLPFRETHRFAECPHPHYALIGDVVSQLRSGATTTASADAALRTSRVMNTALEPYYQSRRGAFWEQPLAWNSLRAHAAARPAADPAGAFVVSAAQRRFFDDNGFVGPFACTADWQSIPVPVKKGRDLHLSEPRVFELCTHPSIVRRVAQVLGDDDLSLYKSRFVVKEPNTTSVVAWHQDTGESNGGLLPDGTPVETVSVWLAFDRATRENGAMQVIPGSHKRRLGDFKRPTRAELVERGELTEADLRRALPLEADPGQFYIFHSWLLHSSGENRSERRRAGLAIRFARQSEQCQRGAEYFPLSSARQPAPGA